MKIYAKYESPEETISDVFRRVFFETSGIVHAYRTGPRTFRVETAGRTREGIGRFLSPEEGGYSEFAPDLIVFEGIEPTRAEHAEIYAEEFAIREGIAREAVADYHAVGPSTVTLDHIDGGGYFAYTAGTLHGSVSVEEDLSVTVVQA